jgi:hypothetical protein
MLRASSLREVDARRGGAYRSRYSTAARWIKKNRLTARGLRGHNNFMLHGVGSARGADQRKTTAQTHVADLG